MGVDISVSFCGLKLANPTMLASGILGETASSLLRAARNGAGAVVTKSIGPKKNQGYPNPTLIELEHGLLNAMGLPNPGIDEYIKELKILKQHIHVPVIGSIYGNFVKEFVLVAKKMSPFVSAFELNLSCPHTTIGEFGSVPENIKKVVKTVRSAVSLPVFVKLTPNTSNIAELASAAENAGADAIVAINTVRGMKIDIETGRPILANRKGGYSGAAIKPIGVRCVYEIFDAVRIPVVGVGGILTGADAIEYIMAGASAVQLGSGLYYRGEHIFTAVAHEIKLFMKKHGYKKIAEMIGLAHRK